LPYTWDNGGRKAQGSGHKGRDIGITLRLFVALR